jgi:hypothetical protein
MEYEVLQLLNAEFILRQTCNKSAIVKGRLLPHSIYLIINKQVKNRIFLLQRMILNYLCTPFREFLNGNGSVVQLVRIHACHAWGRGFESRPDRLQKEQKCSFFYLYILKLYAQFVQ